KLGEDTTQPYTYTWNNVSVGQYTITAVATDNDGAKTTSAGISITVKNPSQLPSVSITSPLSNQEFEPSQTVTINASASDPDGTIAKVEFFADATKIGEDATPPYSYQWANGAPGNHSLTAKAFDNEGASRTSSAVSIIIL